MHRFYSFILALLMFAQSLLNAADARSIIMPETEKFIVDKDGRYIVRPVLCDWIRYLGGGLYFVESKHGNHLFDSSGKEIHYAIPEGTTATSIAVDAGNTKVLRDPEKGVVIFFDKSTENENIEGVCDLHGHVLVPAGARRFSQQMLDGMLFATSEKGTKLTIYKASGQILTVIDASNLSEYILPQTVGKDLYSEGRFVIYKRSDGKPANNAALMDLTGKIIAQGKFCYISRFQNGKAIAITSTSDGVEYSQIDLNGNKLKTLGGEKEPSPQQQSTCITYYQQNPKPSHYGLMSAHCQILTKAKYDALPFWYGKYFIGKYSGNKLHVFDTDGKLMWCGAQDGGEPRGPLSSFQKFLVDHDGVIVRSDPTVPADDFNHKGLYAKDGKWIVEPKFSSLTFFHEAEIIPPLDQFYFEVPR